jgi:hypothetical protein
MGFSIGVIAIKGDHLYNVENLFDVFDYVDDKNDKAFNKWSQAGSYLFDNYADFTNKDIALRCVWVDNGWTLICDPEMVDLIEDQKIEKLSKLTGSEVWTFLIQTTSGSYSFSKFSPNKARYFFAVDGQVIENSGTPLNEEQGTGTNKNIFADNIIAIGKNLGINIEPKDGSTFIVKELAYNEQMKAQLEPIKQKKESKVKNEKPWWKVW